MVACPKAFHSRPLTFCLVFPGLSKLSTALPGSALPGVLQNPAILQNPALLAAATQQAGLLNPSAIAGALPVQPAIPPPGIAIPQLRAPANIQPVGELVYPLMNGG